LFSLETEGVRAVQKLIEVDHCDRRHCWLVAGFQVYLKVCSGVVQSAVNFYAVSG
jgi:hypothetical protein